MNLRTVFFCLIAVFVLTGCPSPDTTPTVDSVEVTAANSAMSIKRGEMLQFSATVTGTNDPAQTVTWSIVETGKKAGTTITGGLLTVASDETV